MQWYDLGIRTENGEALEMARRMGFAGVGVLLPFQKGVLAGVKGFTQPEGIEVSFGVELAAQARAKAKDIRRGVELIAVRGEEREAVETPEVDILFPSREISPVEARLARKNNISLGFDFHQLLHSSGKTRGEVLSCFLKNARLVRKYNGPFILTSGAQSCWDVRSPSDLVAFGKVLGFGEREARVALSGKILKENRKRLGKGWVMPGVEEG